MATKTKTKSKVQAPVADDGVGGNYPRRHARQDGLAPYAVLQRTACTVVGCGAVGRQVMLQLASLGPATVTVFDRDDVEEVNFGVQMYGPNDIGRKKVDVTAADCQRMNPDVEYRVWPHHFDRAQGAATQGAYVFSCVDNMDARRLIFDQAVANEATWFGDCRVLGEDARVITFKLTPESIARYRATLFAQAEQMAGRCTEKLTVYMATYAASVVVSKFAQQIRGMDRPFEDVHHAIKVGALVPYLPEETPVA